jgi:cytochrome c biogenesis protein CcmG/thiol:disulfide interchange protein DsbE
MNRRWTALLTRLLAFSTAVLGILAVYVFFIAPPAPESDGALSSAGSSLASVDTSLQQAPDFVLPTMKGDTFRLSTHRGQVVVLNFWATWCAPCREEIPLFVELQRELGDAGLQFVGVSLDQKGFEAVRPFAQEMGVNYPMVIGDGTVAPRYGGVRALPTTFLIGPDGHIRGYAPGMVTESALRPRVETLLAMVD